MKILSKTVLSDVLGVRVIRMDLIAPEIARQAKPGQFVVLMVSAQGERIPLTIVGTSKDAVTIIFQEAGFTTRLLGRMNAGDSLYALLGPLGHPTEIKNYGNVIIVGGGVGIAEVLPVAIALKAAGNQVITILGSRTKDLLILEEEMKKTSDELYVMTDDGSYGKKGFTTDMLKDVLWRTECGLVYAVGPLPMMRRVADVTKGFRTHTLVSLNALMVDATGMCGCCRVTVGNEVKFSCVDGPEFEASQVDWDELTKRNNIYADKEKHICNLINLQ
jgi:ferredoxin--NADP+ reductase